MNTWKDGTPKSAGNAFDWLTKPAPKKPSRPMTADEKRLAYQRNYYHTKEKANRVNRLSDVARSTSNDKTHAIRRGNSVVGA
jgi:hypothetical protein